MSKIKEFFEKLKSRFQKDNIENEKTLPTWNLDEMKHQMEQESTKVSAFAKIKNKFSGLLGTQKKKFSRKAPSKKPSKSSKKSFSPEEIYQTIFSHKSRPYIHHVFVYALVASITYSVAKMVALGIRPKASTTNAAVVSYEFKAPRLAGDIRIINRRNLFNSEDKQAPKKKKKKVKDDSLCLAADKRSSSPINLVNTVVLQNKKKSIAAVRLATKKDVISLRQGDQIGSFGRIGSIERLKLIFRNSSTGRCEYVTTNKKKDRVKKKFKVLSPRDSKKVLAKKKEGKGINSDGNNFKIKKSYLNDKLKDLSSILTQAKATPVPNPDGTLRFKITQIEPGGVFAALGIQDQDFITRIDGKPIKSYNEVMTLFNSIRSVKELEITVMRNGSEQNLQYSFND